MVGRKKHYGEIGIQSQTPNVLAKLKHGQSFVAKKYLLLDTVSIYKKLKDEFLPI